MCFYKYQRYMKQNRVWIFGVFFSIISLFSGCSDKSEVTEIKVVFPNSIWNRFAPMDTEFEVNNVDKTYEVVVSLSVIDGFALEEVPLEIVITSPDGQQNIINRTIIIKKEENYVGKVYGDVWTTEQVVYSAKQFSQVGTYSVYIENRTQYYDLPKTVSLSFIVRPVKKK